MQISQNDLNGVALRSRRGEIPMREVTLSLPEDVFKRLETFQHFREYPSLSAAARRCVEAYLIEREI